MDKQKKVKLVCLPYAGGSAMMYKAWIDRFADTAEIVQLELPGRVTLRLSYAQVTVMLLIRLTSLSRSAAWTS